MGSTQRHLKWSEIPHPKDKNGKPLCRWCKGKVKPPRECWCSAKCVELANRACNPQLLTSEVFARDKGICAKCGFDCATEERAILKARQGLFIKGKYVHDREKFAEASARLAELKARGFPDPGLRRWWDMDHILPVVEGGGMCGIENLQTLCVPCHKAKTSEMARRRAAERRKNGLIRDSISAIQSQSINLPKKITTKRKSK